MAEQLTDGVYKPWMNGNFNSLKIQNADVVAGGLKSVKYYSSAIFRSSSDNLPTGAYQLEIGSSNGNAFSSGLNTFTCSETGLYAVDSILITGATTDNNLAGNPFYEISFYLVNNNTGKRIKCGNQSPYGNSGQDLVNNTVLKGVMDFNAGDTCSFNIVFNNSLNVPRFKIFGSPADIIYTSSARFIKIN